MFKNSAAVVMTVVLSFFIYAVQATTNTLSYVGIVYWNYIHYILDQLYILHYCTGYYVLRRR